MALPSPPDSSLAYLSDVSNNIKKEELSESEAASTAKEESTGKYLEHLSRRIIEINLNDKDSTHPLIMTHMSTQFRSKHDALPKVTNRDDHQGSLVEHLKKQPDLRVEILNTSSEVDESRGRATVYVWYELTGLEHDLEREAVAVLSWERRQGTWLNVKHTGMRGPSGFK